MKAVISGLLLSELEDILSGFEEKEGFFIKDDTIFVFRHGKNKTIPPHMINHKTNISYLKNLNVEYIISINSVGSLKEKITPDDFLIPDDYISLWDIPTFYDKKIVHVIPSLDGNVRKIILEKAKSSGIEPIDGGVYVQTRGPRFETKAEIRFLKTIGDVVGMTMASEATIANELDIPYASLCLVDNWANGIKEEPLSLEKIKETQKKKLSSLKKFLSGILLG
ncbi:TPA: hypothetical protein DCX16_06230 [bacterium]|nr:hypothetical protein [bacterium]